MLARSADQRLVVTAVVPQPWPPHPSRSDEPVLAHSASMAEQALADAGLHVGNYRAVDYVLRHARSVRDARDFDAFARHFEAVIAYHKCFEDRQRRD